MVLAVITGPETRQGYHRDVAFTALADAIQALSNELTSALDQAVKAVNDTRIRLVSAGLDPAIQPVSKQPITGLDYPVKPGNDDGVVAVITGPENRQGYHRDLAFTALADAIQALSNELTSALDQAVKSVNDTRFILVIAGLDPAIQPVYNTATTGQGLHTQG